ncbi:MAG TPA: GntR family transcriptional regulator [Thermoanaerobacterales bacterium]|nr:GntR family transcriptional regulator [Thermoanaerobacterales bacterium]
MLNIDLDRESGVPIYLQIKYRIKEFIKLGIWRKGFKLPPERELADELRVSRNTVSNAYKELEEEGYIFSHQGKGTFVAYQDNIGYQSFDNEKLINIVDKALDEALNSGYSLDEFSVVCHTRIEEKKEIIKNFKIAFIECNNEQLECFLKRIELGEGVTAVTVLLDDFKKNPKSTNEILKNVDIIVTTFTHRDDVKQLLQDKNKEVIGIGLAPPADTLIKISQIPNTKRVGLYCNSHNFAKTVLKSFKQAGIELPNLRTIISKDPKKIELINELDVIITSPENKKEIVELIEGDKEIIEFSFLPDQGSINMLNTTIVLLKKYSRNKH